MNTKILIVDDETLIRLDLKKKFETCGFRNILEARDGNECIDQILREKPEFVLLDLQMSPIDGIQVLEILQEKGNKTKVIVFTAYTDKEKIKKCFQYGAIEYFTKPVKFDEILYLIKKYEKETVEVNNEKIRNNKIFIVHGRNNGIKNEVARTIEKMGLETIILHEHENINLTIIEKIEKYSDVKFAIIIYTGCDLGKLLTDTNLKQRARQNVVFEHGYLMGKLGRSNVCVIMCDSV
jgi:YesN/AraC family two-component response regulator